jgi:hypothetical protein
MSKLRSARAIYARGGLRSLLVASENRTRELIRQSVLSHGERRLRYLHHRRQYGEAAPRSQRLVCVDPSAIEHVLFPPLHRDRAVTRYDTHVLAGEWDRAPIRDERWFSTRLLTESDIDRRYRFRLEEYAFYRALERGRDSYEAYLEAWQEQLSEFPEGRSTKYGDADYVGNHYELYVDIAENGYKPGRELGKRLPYPEFYDVPVYIGRHGEFVSAGFGKHRIVIARLLGLDSIPVRVNVRHSSWQERRNAVVRRADGVRETTFSEVHPDLRPLIGSGRQADTYRHS